MQRAAVFIDGSNFHHGLKKLGMRSAELDYAKFSQKLVREGRAETRYYIGRLRQKWNKTLYREQRIFLNALEKCGVQCFTGSVEKRPGEKTARKLTGWLDALPRRADADISEEVTAELRKIAEAKTAQYVEKAVDVMIAAHMVAMAHRGEYDAAYLLSADGDFAPAVKEVRATGRKVFAAFAVKMKGLQISQTADEFIPLTKEFMRDCRK